MDQMIIRVQSSEGTSRVKTSPSETSSTFLNKVSKQLNLPSRGWKLYRNRDRTGEIKNSRSKTLSSFTLSHGDMLYLHQSKAPSADEEADKPCPNSSVNRIKEDDIDIKLSKQDGLIHRNKDPQLCHHGPHSKCIHCVPLEPYDQEYLQKHDPPIKHMSFHAYLKQLTSGTDKGKFAMLEDTSCKIKPGCTEHPPWPGGICTKCQPSAITLKRQVYRHVDNILFENPFIVEPFLNYWRKTGNQRMGFLYGRFEQHKDLPLAIRAVVTSIYEPPQENTPDSIQLLDDRNRENVDRLASDLGLQKVGWIFTDLVAEDVRKGTVKHLRDINTHFLTAEECLMAGDFQNQHPSACRLSSTGKFGSKFVTVVCSGNTENHIGFEGFQVSNQCMALVRDDCLVPTIDEPALGYVRESSSEQYVPDVFYKDKDSYGNEVTLLARPMPIEYLLVQVTAAFPKDPQFTFIGRSKGDHFPVENRANIFETQDFNALMKYLQQFSPDEFLTAMSDFHLLLFLFTTDMLPLKENMKLLCTAVKDKDSSMAYHWSKSEHWATVEQLMAATHAPSRPPTGAHGDVDMSDVSKEAGSVAATWTCKHCTFINQQVREACEMCGLPRT